MVVQQTTHYDKEGYLFMKEKQEGFFKKSEGMHESIRALLKFVQPFIHVSGIHYNIWTDSNRHTSSFHQVIFTVGRVLRVVYQSTSSLSH